MVKKLLSLILASLLIVSCFPIASQAAETDDCSSSASTITLDDVSKGNIIDIIVSIDPVSNVQGILLDLDKAYAKFQYQGYEVLDSSLNNGSVVVNSSPVDYTYTDIMAALQFPDGGVSYSQKTDLIKFKFKARSSFSGFSYNFSVKEIYDKNLKDISSSVMSIKCFNESKSEKSLSSIKVTAPSKTTYYVGDSFSSSGMAVTAVYSDGSTKDVTSSASTSGFSSTSAGTKTITVSYTEGSVTKTATFTVTVKAVELSSIAVTSKPTKTTYYIGDNFDTTGMKITATYSNGSTKDVTSGATLSGFSSTSAGTKTITATYSGKTATFTVTVKAVELSSIAVTTKPTKTTYFVGDSFDKTGLKVTATYNNGSTKDVTSSATLSGFSSTSAGTKTVTVSYGGKTATFTVTVKAVEVSGIAVTTKPTKTTYYVGDSFDKTGLKVTATYNNGSTKDVTSSATLSGFSSTSAGTKTVTVSYGGKTATFTVTVKAVEVSGIAVTTKPTKTTYYVGDSFDKTGLKVTATYNNGSTADVTSSVILSGFSSTSAGTKTVTVSYGGKTATFTVTVKAALANTSTVSTTSLTLGNTLKITGAATGGTSPYKYWFQYKKNTSSTWTTLGTAYGTDTTAALKPSAAVSYDVKITVKDNAGKTAEKTYTVSVISTLTNNSKVSTTSLALGDTLKITGAATGGTSPYKYWFRYKKSTSSTWTTLGTAYGTATTAVLKPSAAVSYDVKITVKDNAGTTASKTYTVNVTSTLTNSSKVSTTSLTLGDTLKITGAASGGTSPYKYWFQYKKSTSSTWTTLGTAYGTATTAALKPGAAVSYDVKVNVKDSAGMVKSKEFKITVTVSALQNNSTVSATSVEVGSSVTITGAAKGGTGVYKYAFYYKKASGSSDWTVRGTEFGTAKSVTLSPGCADTYTVKVVVKDSNGTTAEKTFTIKATESTK